MLADDPLDGSNQARGGSQVRRETLFNTVTAVAGFILGAAGLLLAIVTQRPAAVLPWALIVLGALALVPLLRVPWRVRFGITVSIATVLVLSGLAVWVWPDKLATPSGPSPKASPSIIYTPSPEPSAGPVVLIAPQGTPAIISGCVVTVKFTGTPPPGWTYAIGNQAPSQTSFYFVGVEANQGSGEWSASMTLGTKDTPNLAFQMYIVALPTTTKDGLLAAAGPTASFWYQKKLLPEERVAHKFTVQRDNQLTNCAQ